MKILILGGDGYLGWPTAMHFANRHCEVAVFDNFVKRKWELENGVSGLIPIATLHERIKIFKDITGKEIKLFVGDLLNHRIIYKVINEFQPEAIIHYAEQPSAPYSMRSRATAVETQKNNVLGTLTLLFAMQHSKQKIHLIKLGTMGEYGTPNIDIEEGYIEIHHKGRSDRLPFPKMPGSFYHLSKVHDSNNIMFACKIWGLKATDLNQGVVYGIKTEETMLHPKLATNFHYDEIFGTALNRFCVQAVIGHPLTVYGKGKQTRGFLNIVDTLQCVEIAAKNPPDNSEMRVFNQFTEIFSVKELAELVAKCSRIKGWTTEVQNYRNPRIEMEEHYYNPVLTHLPSLGLKPKLLEESLIENMFDIIKQHKDRIDVNTIRMNVVWSKTIDKIEMNVEQEKRYYKDINN
jgi:UDP-sulfoquinovose synthase